MGMTRARLRRMLVDSGIAIRRPDPLPEDWQWWHEQLKRGSVSQVADALGVSTMTVYRKLRRLGVSTRAQIIDPPLPIAQLVDEQTQMEGECRRWVGRITNTGYAIVWRDGQNQLVHRLVWNDTNGAIPTGHEVTHVAQCAHRDCVEAGHLVLMSTRDRIADQTSRHLYAHGERHWNSRLSEDQARLILTGTEAAELTAQRFHVSPGNVRAIRAGRRWKHLNNPSTTST